MTKTPSDQIAQIKADQTIKIDPSDVHRAKDWDDFISLWMISKEIDIKNQWLKGDLVSRISVIYGERSLSKFAEDVKESIRTMEHYRRVARAFKSDRERNLNLSWTYYLIASFTDSYNKGAGKFDSDNRFRWIKDAHDNQWSTKQFQEEIKKKQAFQKDGDVFDYYFAFINKVKNVLLHVEKKSLTDEEKNKLIHKLLDTYNEFMVFLKDDLE
jgi:hypothetical protein